MTYEIIKQNFDRGLWTLQMVRIAVIRKIITPEQFKEITGDDYES